MVFYRILSPSKEYLELQVSLHRKSILSSGDIEKVYTKLLQLNPRKFQLGSISLLQFPYIFDLISICGVENRELSKQLMKQLLTVRPEFKKETQSCVEESLNVRHFHISPCTFH